jgi:hypothetical protein
MKKLLDWEDWGARKLAPEDYRATTLDYLWRFSWFINRARNSLCAGDPPSLIFDGVPLPSLEQACAYFMRQRFANPAIANAAGEALARGFWRHGCPARSIVRRGKAGWRVRVVTQTGGAE